MSGQLTAGEAEAPFLATAAGAVAAITIVLYQAWFMPFFQPFFAGHTEFARVVFYALYGSLLLVSTAVLVTRADIRRKVMPFAIVAAVGLAVTAVHPIGLVTRAYIIAVIMGGATVVLLLVSAPIAMLQLVAAVTALNAALCFVDLLFADGFTNTVGRGAGLAINPNVAAAGILLGAAASHRAVSRTFQLSFLMLTAGSLAVTLSRSTILAAAGAGVLPAVVEIWQRVRKRRPLWASPEGVRPAAVLAVGIVACVSLAATTNRHFRRAVHETVVASVTVADALDEAHHSVAVVVQDAPRAPAAPAGSGEAPLSTAGTIALTSGAMPIAGAPKEPDAPLAAVVPTRADASRIAALDARLLDEGLRNSMSARALFLERSLLAYRNNPFLGMGLELAHPLAPHNTFVLFALAFGHPGWLIPIAVVGLALYATRDARDLPVVIAVVGTMATSHDILLTPSLFLSIAIGIGGMIAREPVYGRDQRVHRSIAFGGAAGVILFALGCLVILLFAPALTVKRLSPAAIVGYRGAYLVHLPTQTFPGVFVTAVGTAPEDTATFLREDSRPLTHVNWKGGAYPPVALGEYAVRDDELVFAPADASDPRSSGHVVELGLPHKVGPPIYALLVTLAVWCSGVFLWLGRRGSVSTPAVD